MAVYGADMIMNFVFDDTDQSEFVGILDPVVDASGCEESLAGFVECRGTEALEVLQRGSRATASPS